MNIKAKCSFIGKNGLVMTKGEVKEVTDEQGKWAIETKLAETAPAAPVTTAAGEKKQPAKA